MRTPALLACLAVLAAQPARADLYADDLSRCLVSSTTPQDRVTLVEWLFAEVALNPTVSALSVVTPQQRHALSDAATKLTVRLLTQDCKTQAATAFKLDGTGVLRDSFGLLGRVSMQSLMNDPAVTAGMGQFAAAMKASTALRDMLRQAGVAPPQ